MTAAPALPLSVEDLSRLRAGLAQRVRALEVVVADARGARRAVAEGVLPGAVLVRARGYSRHAHGTPLPGVALPLAAFDLDLDPQGRWRVVASHVGGAADWPVHHRPDADLADLAGARDLAGVGGLSGLGDPADRPGPAGPAPCGWDDPEGTPPGRPALSGHRRRSSVAAALSACAPGTTAVLLAPAPAEGRADPWAATALAHGVPLVRGSDLVVSAGRLLVRTTSGRSPVGVVLRALEDDELDPVVSDASGGAHGCPGLLTAVRAGGVVLAPALGAGLVDDEGVRRCTPDLVRWALGEEPLLGEAVHPEGPPLVRLVTISDGVHVDVVPGQDVAPALGDPGGRGGPGASAGSSGSPAAGGDPTSEVARLWRGRALPSLLPPAEPASPPEPRPAPAERGVPGATPAALDLRSPTHDLRSRAHALVGEPC